MGLRLDEQLKEARLAFAEGVRKANQDVQSSLATVEGFIAEQIYKPAPPKKTTRKVAAGESKLREQLGQVLDEWKTQWEELREKMPDLRMQFVNDEEMQRIVGVTEENHEEGLDNPIVRTKRKRNGNKDGTDGAAKKKKTKKVSKVGSNGKEMKTESSTDVQEPLETMEDGTVNEEEETQEDGVVEVGDQKVVDLGEKAEE